MAEWRFLLDENIDPKAVTYLEKEEIYTEHVRDVLGHGAADEADVLPHAIEHDLIIVTSDVSDFGGAGLSRRVEPHQDGGRVSQSVSLQGP